MTYDELDALPESGKIVYEEIEIDGHLGLVPHMVDCFALYIRPEDAMLCHDRNGKAWSTGWANGRQWKVRHPSFDRPLSSEEPEERR